MDLVDKLANYGALGVIVGFLLWSALKVGTWVGIKFEPVIESHRALVEQLKESDNRQTASLDRMSGAIETLADGQSQLLQSSTEHRQTLDRLDQRTAELHAGLVQHSTSR